MLLYMLLSVMLLSSGVADDGATFSATTQSEWGQTPTTPLRRWTP